MVVALQNADNMKHEKSTHSHKDTITSRMDATLEYFDSQTWPFFGGCIFDKHQMLNRGSYNEETLLNVRQ